MWAAENKRRAKKWRENRHLWTLRSRDAVGGYHAGSILLANKNEPTAAP